MKSTETKRTGTRTVKTMLACCMIAMMTLGSAACAVKETPSVTPAPSPAASAQPSDGQDIADAEFPFEIDQDGDVLVPDNVWGYQLALPRDAIDQWLLNLDDAEPDPGAADPNNPWLYRVNIDYLDPSLMTMETDLTEEEWMKLIRSMARVTVYDAAELDKLYASGKTPDQIIGEGASREAGRNAGYAYLFTLLPENAEGLPETSIATYKSVYAKMPRVGEKLGSVEIMKPGTQDMPPFSATDLSGATVTNAVFAQKKLTMLNLWGTFCGPCIEEMPDLGKMAASMPEGTQLVGLVVDGDTQLEYAKEIVDRTKADTYTHIIPDDALRAYCASFSAVPTTIFVDADGNTVGEPVVGAMSEEKYRKIMEERLALLAAPEKETDTQ